MKVSLGLTIGLLLLLTYLTGIRAAYVLSYGLGLLYLAAVLWPPLASWRLEVQRNVSLGRLMVGETFSETFTILKPSPIPIAWLEIRDRSRVLEYHPGRVLSLARRRTTWTARGVFRQRGWNTFGPTRLLVAEPFGLFRRELRFERSSRYLVHPRIWPLPDLLVLPAAQPIGQSQRLGSWADQPPETGGVREYRPGDAFGRIHWPLSVKAQQLVSKTFEQPLATDLWIVLDLQRGVHRGEGQDSTLEYAASLAASLAAQVRQRGRAAGLIANDLAGTLVRPQRSDRADTWLMDHLATVEDDGLEPVSGLFGHERARQLARQAVALISPNPDPTWVRSLLSIRGRGLPVLFLYLDGPSFEPGAPPTPVPAVPPNVHLHVIRQGDLPGLATPTRPLSA